MADTKSDWKDSFLFVGNQLALDFLNTQPVIDGTPTEFLTGVDAVLRWFRAAELLTPKKVAALRQAWEDSPRAQRTVEEIREFRESLRREVVAWEGGASVRRATIEELNRLLAAHPMLVELRPEGGTVRAESCFDIRRAQDLFAPLAQSAAALFTRADRSRVRKCGNGQCVLHFLDISKKGTRRWCSMRMCGNRLKVAAYAARQRD